jgi:HEAT repeat protein
MIFYCPNCWTRVKEDEKVCPECKANIEPLDHRSYFEKLVNALNHSERTTRIRAAYILGELKDRRAVEPFAEVVDKPRGIEDVFFIEMVAIALGKLDGEEALPILIRLMDHPSFLVRRAALNSLNNFRSEEALKVIKKALKDPSPNVQELAQKILQTR